MDSPDLYCETLNYTLKSNSSSKITHEKESCANTEECRTAIIDLSSPAVVSFNFTMISNADEANNTLITNDYIYNITCGAEK